MKPSDKAPGGQGRGPRPKKRRAEGSCPLCGKPTKENVRPFCSRRCADIDLARWLNGVYAIPGTEADIDGGEPGGE